MAKIGQNEERWQKNYELEGNTAKDSQSMGEKRRKAFRSQTDRYAHM